MMFSSISGPLPLIGRETLLAGIEEALRSQDLYGAFVYGETGAGKSVLARHLIQRLENEFVPFHVAPAVSLGRIPYGALAPFLEAARAEDMASPRAVLRAVLSFVRSRSEGKPLLIVVDDAHLLDDPSSHLLAQLVTSRTVGLVAFARPVAPVSDELISLARDGLLERFEIGPMDYEAAGDFCERVLGAPVVRGSGDRLRDAASGNPLFLKAILDESLTTGQLTLHDGVWLLEAGESPLPTALVDLVRSVLLELPEAERAAFEVTAAAGMVPFDDLMRFSSEDAVSSLFRAGLLRNVPEQLALAVVTYPTYARAVREVLPVGRSNELHLRLREARADDAVARLPPVAQLREVLWSLECGEPVGKDQLMSLAGTAVDLVDPQCALQLLDALPDGGRDAAARLIRAEALLDLGRVQDSRDAVAGLLDTASDPRDIAGAGVLEIRQLLAAGEDVDGTDAVIKRWEHAAASATSSSDTTTPEYVDGEQRRLVMQVLGWNLTGRYAEAIPALEALLARGGEDRDVTVMGNALLGEALGAVGRSSEGRQRGERARSLLDATPQLPRPLYRAVVLRQVSTLVHCGDLTPAQRISTDFRSNPFGNTDFVSGSLAVFEGILHVRSGKFLRGMDLLRPALTSLRVADPDGLLPYALGVLSWAAAAVGESELSSQCAEELETVSGRGSRMYGMLAAAYAAAGTDLLDRTYTARLLPLAREARARGWLGCEKDILELAVTLTHEQADAMLAEVTRSLQGAEAGVLNAYADAVLAGDPAALVVVGDRAEALRKYVLAAEACRRAMELYAEAGDTRSHRGLAGVLRRRRELVDGSVLVGEGDGESSTLTIREQQVAVLTLNGMSNRDIATALTVSVRTVEGHLYRIFMKLGVTKREELPGRVEPFLTMTDLA